MMDTQRLIALVVFSFSALLLWDAWQKHNAPKVPPAPAAVTVPAGVPQPTGQLAAPPAPAAPGASTAPAAPTASPVVSGGEAITVRTDLFDVELSTAGGDIRRLTLREVHSALDRTKPLTLMEPDAQHYFVTQTGLLGEGLPNHKTVYQPEPEETQAGFQCVLPARKVNTVHP